MGDGLGEILSLYHGPPPAIPTAIPTAIPRLTFLTALDLDEAMRWERRGIKPADAANANLFALYLQSPYKRYRNGERTASKDRQTSNRGWNLSQKTEVMTLRRVV